MEWMQKVFACQRKSSAQREQHIFWSAYFRYLTIDRLTAFNHVLFYHPRLLTCACFMRNFSWVVPLNKPRDEVACAVKCLIGNEDRTRGRAHMSGLQIYLEVSESTLLFSWRDDKWDSAVLLEAFRLFTTRIASLATETPRGAARHATNPWMFCMVCIMFQST